MQTRGVHQPNRPPVACGARFHRVPGRAGQLGDQGALRPEQCIEQRRLSGIRPPCEHHERACTQALGARRRGEQAAHVVAQCRMPGTQRLGRHRAVVLVGKIDLVREERLQFHGAIAQRLQPSAQPAVQLVERRPRLHRCRAVHQVRDRLGFEQAQLPVEHRAPRELPCRRGPRPRRLQRRQQSRRRGEPAMTRELHEILSREARRRPEHRCHSAIDERPIRRDEPRQRRHARSERGDARHHTLHHLERADAAHAHHGDRGAPGRRGEGDDGIGQHAGNLGASSHRPEDATLRPISSLASSASPSHPAWCAPRRSAAPCPWPAPSRSSTAAGCSPGCSPSSTG